MDYEKILFALVTTLSLAIFAFVILMSWYFYHENKGFLTCYPSNGVILSKYGNVKHDGEFWSVKGKNFYYETNNKCIFIKDKKGK